MKYTQEELNSKVNLFNIQRGSDIEVYSILGQKILSYLGWDLYSYAEKLLSSPIEEVEGVDRRYDEVKDCDMVLFTDGTLYYKDFAIRNERYLLILPEGDAYTKVGRGEWSMLYSPPDTRKKLVDMLVIPHQK